MKDKNKIQRDSKYLKFIDSIVINPCDIGNKFDNNLFDRVYSDLDKYNEFYIKRTEKVYAFIFEQKDNASLKDIFTSFGLPFKKIIFETKEQLNKFVKNNKSLLSSYVTYFLFRDKKNKKYFAIGVSKINGKVSIFKEISLSSSWSILCKIRFVFLSKNHSFE